MLAFIPMPSLLSGKSHHCTTQLYGAPLLLLTKIRSIFRHRRSRFTASLKHSPLRTLGSSSFWDSSVKSGQRGQETGPENVSGPVYMMSHAGVKLVAPVLYIRVLTHRDDETILKPRAQICSLKSGCCPLPLLLNCVIMSPSFEG